jgi:hypothetical protein
VCAHGVSYRESRAVSHQCISYRHMHTANIPQGEASQFTPRCSLHTTTHSEISPEGRVSSHRSVYSVYLTGICTQRTSHGSGWCCLGTAAAAQSAMDDLFGGGEPAASCAPSPFPHPQQPCSVPRLALKSHTNRNHSETGVDIVQRPTLSAIMLRSAAFPRLPAV